MTAANNANAADRKKHASADWPRYARKRGDNLGFPSKVKEETLVRSGRHCCICHKFCGTKIEIHHILPKVDGGTDTFENAIALCFDCHADMSSYDHKHPKGTKYTPKELIRHRDNWYQKISGNIGVANREEVIETDKNVYQLLVKILPWNGSIRYLRGKDFSVPFYTDALNDLHEYYEQCLNPAFEFIDPDLEGLRVELTNRINSFRDALGIETFPSDFYPEVNAVPSEWKHEQPERFFHAANLLNTGADSICEIYDSIVKTATRKLGIIPDNMA